jgi:NAD(P)-dependent dehydrogenase (short-subunit alcohol dehydrogenase family)
MYRLDGKIVLVTGGGAGIGLAVAKRFVAEGAEVMIVGRRQAELDKAVAILGDKAMAIAADVTAAADRNRMFDTVRANKGRLDILIANAGTLEHGMFGSFDEGHYDRQFDLNTKGTVFTVQGALPLLVNGGSVVLIGSISGSKGTAGYGVYAASKAAIRSFARTWANELAPRAIRVNTLSPGPTQTAMYDQLSEEMRNGIASAIPLGHPGQPSEIAAAALFLASDESSFVTGIELFADGGLAQV